MESRETHRAGWEGLPGRGTRWTLGTTHHPGTAAKGYKTWEEVSHSLSSYQWSTNNNEPSQSFYLVVETPNIRQIVSLKVL